MCYRITSVFVEQNCTECDFSGTDSWVILSPIEQSIKRKIEAIGKPLKDWDINIYRGVLTGCNEAFIISKQVRDEILSNCQTPEEYDRTAALIRPILRGRDIKRYSYDWANLWLINSHNGIKGKIPRINIDEYPAVKAHLDKYWSKIKNRADQGDTPYNLRNCAYLEDFSKPKILWKRIGSILRFSYVESDSLGLDSTCIATGKHIEYLCCVLNSSMGHYLLKDAPKTGTGDLLISVQAIDPIRVPPCIDDINFELLLKHQVKGCSKELDNTIDNAIFDLYQLSAEEREYIKQLAL